MSPTWAVREIPTTLGPARIHRCTPRGSGRAPVIVLGHGAGGGVDAPDLQALAAAATSHGFRVVLVEQPWRLAGRRIAPRPEALDDGWVQVLTALRIRGPLIVGGRSAGARVACRTAGKVGVVAVVCLAFPLHPPGRPDRSRAADLAGVDVPVVVIQGDRDAFGSAAELRQAVPGVAVVPVIGGDHGLARGALAPAIEEALELLRAGME